MHGATPSQSRAVLLLVLLSMAASSGWGAGAASAQEPQMSGPFDVFEVSIPDLQGALEAGRVTSVELVDAYLARVRAFDQAGPSLNSILHLNQRARAEAAELDRERAESGARGPLHGIPILLKDNFNTADMPTTAGSVALAGMIPPEDATVVRRLREAGAVILGKTNLHEFAYGYTSISSLGGQTRNPYDPTRIAGGSSGGTGAAVAASLAAIGWGSDTCGSIRVPAAVNGLFGLRPTKGLTSIHGIIPLAHTQDVPGPLARSVVDLAIGLDATVGPDPADPSTLGLVDRPVPRFVEALRPDALEGVRIGILANYFGEAPEDEEVGELVRGALALMAGQGAEVVELVLPDLDALLAGTSVIAHEFKFDLLDYLAATSTAPVATLGEILESGLYHNAVAGSLTRSEAVEARETEAYRDALSRQAAAREAVIAFLEDEGVDALAYPSVRRPPAPIGSGQSGVACQLSAATGLPALTIPAGLTADGLPAGFELLGRPWDDAVLVGLAFAHEQAVRPRHPPAGTPSLVVGVEP